jgi:hypothetical protein
MTLPETTEPDNQLYIWDTKNPRSLINLVPNNIKEAMLRLIHERPDLCDLDETALRRKVVAETGLRYTATDNQIRFRFWLEYDRCARYEDKMLSKNIAANVVSVEFFSKTFLKSIVRVCWMLCPIVDFEAKATEALCSGIDEMREIMAMPNLNSKGTPDYKIINAKIAIFKMIDARVNGAAVQRTLNVNRNEVSVIGEASVIDREAEVERKIKELETHENRELGILATTEKAILPDGFEL